MKNGFETRPLGEIVSIAKGKKHDVVFDSPANGSRRYIQIDDLRNDSNLKFTTEQGVEVSRNDVIIAWDGANAATVGFGLDGFIGSTLARLRLSDSKVDSKYFGWFLRSQSPSIRKKCSGATIPHVDKSFLQSIQVPLPPLPIQKQIAAILEKADAAREMRRRANQLTEQFLKSAFLEMFGDPVTNPKGWGKSEAGKIFEIKLGKMLDEKQFTGKNLRPYIRNVNVQWGGFDLTDIQEMDFTPAEFERNKLRRGDILVCEGGEVGRCAIWNEEIVDCGYQKALHRLRVIEPIIEGQYFINFMKLAATHGLLLRDTSQVTIAHFTAEKFREFKVLVPPMEEQQKFAALVEKVESLRAKQRASQKELDNLFNSLMQRAFKGELVQ